jgi:ribosomal protein S12 methylthiotransferase accessory factor
VTGAPALGEAIETAAAEAPPATHVHARLGELENALDPRAIGLYPARRYGRGFPYRRFDADRGIRWEEGRWLDDGSPVLVPSGLVRLDERDRLCQATSNGLAAGRSIGQATTNALLELVERDAIMAHWLGGRPGRPLAGEPGVVVLDAAVALPVVACIALGDGRTTPAVAIGAACRPDLATAVAHARREAAAVGAFLTRTLELRYPSPPAAAVRTPREHALFRLRRGQLATRALLGGDEIHADAVPRGTDVVAALVAAGLRPAVVELDAPPGWRVVRALVAGLQPLWFGHGFRRTVTPRIRTLAGGRLRRALHPLP